MNHPKFIVDRWKTRSYVSILLKCKPILTVFNHVFSDTVIWWPLGHLVKFSIWASTSDFGTLYCICKQGVADCDIKNQIKQKHLQKAKAQTSLHTQNVEDDKSSDQTTVNVLKFRTLAAKEAVWSGPSLFATLTSILWIPALITNILFEKRENSVRNFRTFTVVDLKS